MEMFIYCNEIGTLIYSKYRAEGYSNEPLNLLVEYAFQELGVESIYNNFEASRDIGLKVHNLVGLINFDMEDKFLKLILIKNNWEEIRKRLKLIINQNMSSLFYVNPFIAY